MIGAFYYYHIVKQVCKWYPYGMDIKGYYICGEDIFLGEYNPWLSQDKEERREAQHLCNLCPVQQQCLTYAKDLKPTFGVWGGKDFSQDTEED